MTVLTKWYNKLEIILPEISEHLTKLSQRFCLATSCYIMANVTTFIHYVNPIISDAKNSEIFDYEHN